MKLILRADVLLPVLLATAISGALLQLQSAKAAPATVFSIGDGDTLRVREGNLTVNLRLACMMPLRPTRHPLVLRPGNN